MKIEELQDVVDLILEQEIGPEMVGVCPVVSSPNLINYYGKALSSRGWPNSIRISKKWFTNHKMSDEGAVSIIIHEVCHIVMFYLEHANCRFIPPHGSEFMELSKKWHSEFGMYEDRSSEKFHGKVYSVAADEKTRIEHSLP